MEQTIIDDQCLTTEHQADSQPGHLSEGDEDQNATNFSLSLLESWKADSRLFASRIKTPEPEPEPADFIVVTKKKNRPRINYSKLTTPSVLTRLSAGKIARVSFSHRLK